jgi:ELWxxDGT repeat protein
MAHSAHRRPAPVAHAICFIAESLEPRRLLSATASVVAMPDGGQVAITAPLSNQFSITNYDAAALGSSFIFPAVAGSSGLQPWISNGTTAGTSQIKSVTSSTATITPQNFVGGSSVVFFETDDGTNDGQVWRTDGTASETFKVSNVTTPGDIIFPGQMEAVGNTVFFLEKDNTANVQSLWGSDSSGTMNQHEIAQTSATVGGFILLGTAGNNAYYETVNVNTANATFTYSLWSITSPTASAHLINTFNEDFGGQGIFPGVAFDGDFYFSAANQSDGLQIWKSNGSTATEVTPAIATGFTGVQNLTVAGDRLYFAASDGTTAQVWSTDGSTLHQDSKLASTAALSNLRDFADVNGTLFFDYTPNGRLYTDDDESVSLVPLASDGGGKDPGYFAAVGDTLFFNALEAGDKTATLYESDGDGMNIVPGIPGTDPRGMTNVNGTLFYQADDGSSSDDLHVVTGIGTVTPAPVTVSLGDTIEATIGEPVKFTATVTGAKIKEINWDPTNSGTYLTPPVKGPTFDYSGYTRWPTKGKYLAKAEVVTTDDKKFIAYVEVVLKPKPLTVVLELPNVQKILMSGKTCVWVPTVPLPYTIKVTNYYPGEPVTANLNFGDGTTEKGVAVDSNGVISGFHSYPAPPKGHVDTFDVTVYFDGEQKDSDTVNVDPDEVALDLLISKVPTIIFDSSGDNATVQVKKKATDLLFYVGGAIKDKVVNSASTVIDMAIGGGNGNDAKIQSTVTNSVNVDATAGGGSVSVGGGPTTITCGTAPVTVYAGSGNATVIDPNGVATVVQGTATGKVTVEK